MPESFDIDKVAELARISLEPGERDRLKKDLENILRYVEKLGQLDTSQVEPTSHVLNIENVFREDVPRRSDVIDKVLKHAPERAGNYFKVPKVVEG